MNNNRPEWFEIAENEALEKKSSSTLRLPILILLTSLSFVGAGMIFTQNQQVEHSPALTAIAPSSASASMETPQIAQLPTRSDDDEYENDGTESGEFKYGGSHDEDEDGDGHEDEDEDEDED